MLFFIIILFRDASSVVGRNYIMSNIKQGLHEVYYTNNWAGLHWLKSMVVLYFVIKYGNTSCEHIDT